MRIALLVLAAGCRHAAVTAPITDTDDDDIPDVEDRCPDIATDCFPDNDQDDDGCPDPGPGPIRIHLPLHDEDRARLASIARSIPGLRPTVDLVVVGRALPNEPPGLALERATAIALRLEEDGAPLERLLARAAPPAHPDDTTVVEIMTTGCASSPTAPSASR